MGDAAVGSAVMVQFVMAGFMGALWIQHWAYWRADKGDGSLLWLMLFCGTLTVLLLFSGFLLTVPSGSDSAAMLFMRGQLIAGAVLLILPVVKSFSRGRPIRRLVTLVAALFLGRAVLWLTTDLVWAHPGAIGQPLFGPLGAPTLVAPVLLVAWYVATSAIRMVASATRSALIASAAAGIVVLVIAFLIPPGPVAEVLKGVWVLPLVVALHEMDKFRIRSAHGRVVRQRRLRDALAEVSAAALLSADRWALLKLAETSAREHVGDDTVIGSIGPGDHGPFTATFHSATGLPMDELAGDFLADLSRIVSAGAERMRLIESLRDEALTDNLTRLPNRKALELHLEQVLPRAGQEGTCVGLLYCDIDEFKGQNDKHGHAWGDELLIRMATYLRQSLGQGAFVARFGGDEFVVVIHHADSRDAVVDVARGIRTGLDLPATAWIPPLLSVGVAMWAPLDSTDPDLLLREADAAMFEAKRSGAGVAVFDDALRATMVAEENLGREIDAALLHDELELHYQPIVDSGTLDIVGVEALIRWPHRDGMRMPDRWIPFAEKTGLIVPIGRWVVASAREGAQRLGLPVAVNFAARQLAEPRFVQHLREDWGDSDWHLLTIEITESDLLEDVSHVIDTLSAVRALGARISIDDFGTGHSSFERLAHLPVDVLKIDQGFIRGLDTPGGVAIVRAIVALAQAYSLDIIAEGVERVEQAEILADLGVPKLQGYLFGRPSVAVPQRVELSAARHVATARERQDQSPVLAATGAPTRAAERAAQGDEPPRAGEQRDHAGAQRDQAGEQRDQAGEQRDQAGEQRDRAGEQRDHAGAQRDQAGEQRDQAGEQRDRAGEQRDHAGEQRDHAGAQRDQAGEQRDRAGEQRDQAGEQRDQAGEQRDQAAEERDQAAEFDATELNSENVEAAHARAATARLEAASDRRWSALDRQAAAGERTHADLDRDDAMSDRGAAAGERTHADLDRDDAMSDRGAAAGERTHADVDRDDAMADRGASAKDRGLASRDALTGVLRRGAGLVELEREIARSRGTGRTLALAFVDVDQLKAVNDTRGHAAGDRMLLEVANTLRAKMRPDDLIFRYGGDEFVCALAGLNVVDASLRMSLLDAALAEAPEHGSVTCGIAELQEGDTLETLMARADASLYVMRFKQRDASDTLQLMAEATPAAEATRQPAAAAAEAAEAAAADLVSATLG